MFLNTDIENMRNEIRDQLSYLTEEQLLELRHFIENFPRKSQQESEAKK